MDKLTPMHERYDHPLRSGMSRRTAVQAGALGMFGLSLDALAAARAAAAPAGEGAVRPPKSVIYVFLSGGLAQHESFDPKPDGPLDIRGTFKTIATKTPGLQVCEHLPMLAARSEKWAVVRSLTHTSNDHSAGHHIMLTGRSDIPIGFDPSAPKKSDWPALAALAQQ
jgi:hypothetical protein